MRNVIRRTPGGYRAIVYALLVHVVVIALLVIGFRWSGAPSSVAQPNTIQAVVAEDPEKKKLEAERRQAEAERKRQEADARKKEEEARRKEEERRVEERRKQAEAEKEKQAELKRKQEEEARQRQEAERKRAEAETQRKRQEAEARKKREEDESRRKAAEESLKQQLAEEEQGRVEAARAARAASEAERYRALIRQKVSRNWARPAGTPPGLKCVVRVRLAPGGDVLGASIAKGSGNAVFDRSVEVAVYKASPLPLPPDPDLFPYFREIEFLFTPEG